MQDHNAPATTESQHTIEPAPGGCEVLAHDALVCLAIRCELRRRQLYARSLRCRSGETVRER
ncbi:MAG: hypothetical protein AAGC55_24435, partial [Myxococcota bacterium]